MEAPQHIYIYEGPVCEFGRCVQNVWVAKTIAVSEKKARSNLAYQWKINNNRTGNSRVELPGEIRTIA